MAGGGARSRFGQAIAVPLDEPDATLEVHMAWRKHEKSATVFAFLNSARSIFHTETGRDYHPA